MAENINLSEQQAAIDYFMEVYCPDPDFKGFIGITGDDQVFTNRTQVSELYKNNFLGIGPGLSFNVKFHSEEIEIDHTLSTRQVVYANITAFNEHVITKLITGSDTDMQFVQGHYESQWRINSQGYPCLSRFADAFLKVFSVNQVTFLNRPWNKKI